MPRQLPLTTVSGVGGSFRTGLTYRIARCGTGLFLFGSGIAFFVRAELGLAPWDVFHQGLADLLDIGLGTAVIVVAAAVLLLWIPLRQRPGIGTLMNAVEIGFTVNLTEQWIPETESLPLRAAYLAAWMAVIALGSGIYIGAELGLGPRDGLMTGLNARYGISIRTARTVVEVVVVVAGLALGGSIGLGTFLFAFGIGPLVQLALTRIAPVRTTVEASRPRGRSAGDEAG